MHKNMSKRMRKMLVILFAFVAQFAVAASLAPRALAQSPVPLPTDNALAAYVGVSGSFQSPVTGETQNLNMSAWAAAFAPGETFDFSALDSRAFLTLGLPEDQGWGLFDALDANLTVSINITDSQSRLGSVKVYDVDSGLLVATLAATPDGGQVLATIQNDAAARNYRVNILSAGGGVLSTLAVDLGKWDTVYPFAMPGGFEPYYPAPISAPPHYTVGASDVSGTQGDPKQAPGVVSGTSMGLSKSACALDYKNDNQALFHLAPPSAFAQYAKRDIIWNSVNVAAVKSGDSAAYQTLQAVVNQATVRDPTQALGNIDLAPYDDATGLWHITFQGQATAVLAVPFERKRKTSNGFNLLVAGATALFAPKKDFLSLIWVAAGNLYLSDVNNQIASGFKPGDIFSLGDIYALIAAESDKNAIRNDPILEDVTFTVQPDIAPPNGAMYSGTVSSDGFWTASAPAGPANGGSILFNSMGSASLQLPKGYKWHVAGNVISPGGAYDTTTINFQTPTSSVVVPATLKVLLTLNVYTVNATGPFQAQVQLMQGSTVVATGTTSMQADGQYRVSFSNVQPGNYTVSARMSNWSGSVTTAAQRGLSQDVTVTLSQSPPP